MESNNSKDKLVVIISESVVASVAKDVITFLMFSGLMYFNHKVLSGNGWIDAIFIVFVLMWLTSLKSSQIFRGKASDAIKWLQDRNA